MTKDELIAILNQTDGKGRKTNLDYTAQGIRELAFLFPEQCAQLFAHIISTPERFAQAITSMNDTDLKKLADAFPEQRAQLFDYITSTPERFAQAITGKIKKLTDSEMGWRAQLFDDIISTPESFTQAITSLHYETARGIRMLSKAFPGQRAQLLDYIISSLERFTQAITSLNHDTAPGIIMLTDPLPEQRAQLLDHIKSTPERFAQAITGQIRMLADTFPGQRAQLFDYIISSRERFDQAITGHDNDTAFRIWQLTDAFRGQFMNKLRLVVDDNTTVDTVWDAVKARNQRLHTENLSVALQWAKMVAQGRRTQYCKLLLLPGDHGVAALIASFLGVHQLPEWAKKDYEPIDRIVNKRLTRAQGVFRLGLTSTATQGHFKPKVVVHTLPEEKDEFEKLLLAIEIATTAFKQSHQNTKVSSLFKSVDLKKIKGLCQALQAKSYSDVVEWLQNPENFLELKVGIFGRNLKQAFLSEPCETRPFGSPDLDGLAQWVEYCAADHGLIYFAFGS